MITFWILAVAMLALALALVLPPLLGRRYVVSTDRKALNLAIHEERLADLERERAEGRLDEPDYGRARAELDRELLGDVEPGSEDHSRAPGRGWVSASVVGIGIPLLSVALYAKLGDQEAVHPEAMVAEQPGSQPVTHPQAGGQGPGSVEAMVDGLAKRMRENPDNAEGWVMLGRSYTVLKRYAEAADAFGKANVLAPNDAEVLAGLAEAKARLAGGRLGGEPERLLARVLEIQPNHVNALWLSGLAAQQRGEPRETLRYWERLEGLVGGDTAKTIAQFVAQLREKVGEPGPAPGTRLASTAAAPAASAESSPASPSTGGLSVNVTLSPDLSAGTSPGDTVFIFARAAQGPRMPLAIVRKTVADLPVSVTLDDSMAMAPTMKLSAFPRVVVGARVSKSGTAMPQSGDLEGLSASVPSSQSQPIRITIDRRI